MANSVYTARLTLPQKMAQSSFGNLIGANVSYELVGDSTS